MSKKLNPKVSIICAVYNEEKTFKKHLQYLVNQTYKNKEIIIVDDGSIDKTSEMGKKFAKQYKFVKYHKIKHVEGCGCVRPRMEAIKYATGDVFCIVDADGYYEKNNLKDGIKKLFGDKRIAAVVPRMHAWNPDNFIAKYRAVMYESRFIDSKGINKAAGEGKYSPWLMKREIYNNVGEYNIKDAYSEDLRLARRILDKGYKIVHEPKCHWYHNLGESVLDVIKKNFNIGRMHSSKRKFSLDNSLKVVYFSLPFFIIIIGVFYNILFLLLLFHILPMFLNGVRIFWIVRKVEGRFWAFYSPLVSYIINIPYVFGFYFGLVFPYKK